MRRCGGGVWRCVAVWWGRVAVGALLAARSPCAPPWASVEWGGRWKGTRLGSGVRWAQLSVSAEGGLQIERVCCLEPACTRCHHVLHQDGALRRRHAAQGTPAAMASAAAASSAAAAASSAAAAAAASSAAAAAASSATSFTQATTIAASCTDSMHSGTRPAALRTTNRRSPPPCSRGEGAAARRGGVVAAAVAPCSGDAGALVGLQCGPPGLRAAPRLSRRTCHVNARYGTGFALWFGLASQRERAEARAGTGEGTAATAEEAAAEEAAGETHIAA